MNYLVTWSEGEEVEYLFLCNFAEIKNYLEEDKNYIVAPILNSLT